MAALLLLTITVGRVDFESHCYFFLVVSDSPFRLLLPSSFKANKLRSNIAQLTPWFGSIFVVDQYIAGRQFRPAAMGRLYGNAPAGRGSR